ncbi:4Fe-4S binding protein, partial [Thermodesulfobacteriota bacterium]
TYPLNYDGLKRVAMINCVGARIDDRTYCGRFCCITAMKNAFLLKTAHPDAQVTILQRDIMAFGTVFEEYYQKALQIGVTFIRYTIERPPEVTGNNKVARKIRVYHELTGREIKLDVDAVVLTTPLVPAPDNQQLSRMLKVPIGSDGFFLEAHQKLRPVEFPADGIFIAGCARYPTEITECVAQGYAAAAKAAIPMAQGQIISDAYTSEVNPLRCSACGRCVHICPFGAVDWVDFRNQSGEGVRVAQVNTTECKGCGLCVASCISGAIQLKGFTDEEILAMIDSIVDYHETVL